MAFTAKKNYLCDKCGEVIYVGEGYSWTRRGPKKYYCWRCAGLEKNPKKERGGAKGDNPSEGEVPEYGGNPGDVEYESGAGQPKGGGSGGSKGKGEGGGGDGNEGNGNGEGDNELKYDVSLPKDMEHMREWLKETGMLDADMKDESIKEVLKELYEEWKKEHPEEAEEMEKKQQGESGNGEGAGAGKGKGAGAGEGEGEEDQQPPPPEEELSDNHEDYDLLMTFIKAGEHVYLWGPAGSGKSTAAEKVAEDLSLDYGYISLDPYASSTALIGYRNAHGDYVSTPFYDIYKDGGVFCVDELDNASSSLLVTLNSALANNMCAFPCGMVKRHPDFRLVATGNTDGKGGTPSYPERRQLDSAVLDRYLSIHWDYDNALELQIAMSINPKTGKEAAKFVQEVRAAAIELAPDLIVSPRATFRIAKLMSSVSKKKLVEATIFKGYDEGVVAEVMKGKWQEWKSV